MLVVGPDGRESKDSFLTSTDLSNALRRHAVFMAPSASLWCAMAEIRPVG